MNDPFRTFDDLREAYLRYLDSPFRLRYPALMEERRRLLDQDRQLYREPLFEPIVPYETSDAKIDAACAEVGTTADVAEYIATSGLFPAGRKLFRHQLDAWKASRDGEAVVVTTGTGSGKTECYLLPVFAHLVEESARWGAPEPRSSAALWWSHRGQRRIPQRLHDAGRTKALRALFLYPLNALIEDQLARIRSACDSEPARQWLDARRSGNRLWFGRYTGMTPVSGRATDSKRNELRRRLREMQNEWHQARRSADTSGSDDILAYFQDPEGSEMWSRWDMQEAPPDILITNYSMLNIMLMRSLEASIFDQTKHWLQADRENKFHLVVDELHTYRGTPGTEVGYLLRTFLYRLGLTPDSPQLRIISTSASIDADDPASLEYLEQFFGRDRGSFRIIDGTRATFPSSGRRPAAGAFRALAAALDTDDLGQGVVELARAIGVQISGRTPQLQLGDLLAKSGVLEQVREAASTEPFTASGLASAVFGADPEAEEGAPRPHTQPCRGPRGARGRGGGAPAAQSALLLPQYGTALGLRRSELLGPVGHDSVRITSTGGPDLHGAAPAVQLLPEARPRAPVLPTLRGRIPRGISRPRSRRKQRLVPVAGLPEPRAGTGPRRIPRSQPWGVPGVLACAGKTLGAAEPDQASVVDVDAGKGEGFRVAAGDSRSRRWTGCAEPG